jgi:hypothetical protein
MCSDVAASEAECVDVLLPAQQHISVGAVQGDMIETRQAGIES